MAAHMCCRVFAGCYERTVFGYDLIELEEEGKLNFQFKELFTNNAHTGCIKSLAASHRFLASGSTDELVNLYDLEQKVELGSLMQHDGSVTSLAFHDDGHMVSGSEDGAICIWGTERWECMKIMKGHKGVVNSVAVHPSGKLALSVSGDKTLRTWNLLKGRAAYTTNIKSVSDIVLWSPDGQLYVAVVNNRVDIYDITTATVCCSFKCNSKLLASCFITDRVVAVSGEGDVIQLLRVNEEKTSIEALVEFRAHDSRIKSLACLKASGSNSPSSEKWLVSAGSDGFLKVWRVDTEKISETPVLLSKVNTKARLTCLAVGQVPKPAESSNLESQPTKRLQDEEVEGAAVKKKKKKGRP